MPEAEPIRIVSPRPAAPHLTPQEINALLALRELARRNFRDFLEYWRIADRQPLKWAWFHDYLADVMHSIALRQRKRVIINMPPRHLKSTLASQAWHAWMIGREDGPNSAMMSLSASATLASRDSRRTLNMMQCDWYKTLFPHVALTKENEAEWETAAGSYRIAVGRGGTVTGRGGAHILVDDLIKADEGNSEHVREQANEWMGETLASRLNDPMSGTITVIMQRLHERDVTGYLKSQMKYAGADQYEHIVLPLEAPCRTLVTLDGKLYKDRPAGDLLQPERHGPDQVAALRVSMRANFDGQYQQNPQKQVGGMLDPSNLIRLDASTPELIKRFGLIPHAYLDFATREKELNKDDPDFSTILVAAKDQLGRLFFLDLFRRQCDYEALGRALIGMQRVYQFRCIKGEKGGLINTFLPSLRILQRLTGTFFELVPFKGPSSRGDKVARSMSFQGLLNAGLIVVPAGASWLVHLEAEMRSFPNGAHDDVIDVAAMATNDTLDIREGEAPVYKTTDEQELMDQEHKHELDRRIVAARHGDDGGYRPDKDLDW